MCLETSKKGKERAKKSHLSQKKRKKSSSLRKQRGSISTKGKLRGGGGWGGDDLGGLTGTRDSKKAHELKGAIEGRLGPTNGEKDLLEKGEKGCGFHSLASQKETNSLPLLLPLGKTSYFKCKMQKRSGRAAL